MRVNKAKHTTTLMVDGAIVKQWIDTDGFVGKGTGLRFVHQGQGAVKLNNLKISEWASRDVEPVGREMANVKAIFRNGGTVTFQLQKWTTEAVTGTNASLGNVIFRPAAFERMDVDLK